ncbi:AtzE family amidohydrolase [Cupriavidus alkaliphilus]|uniref:AtzE family amidohydrolase n=1 Tax=Cupriavidus alkaliphilus TaxID=942866 RepID=UPI0016093A7B|nr:AtzE family amidohydrolase [Cupriavidus alkaliphilus]MBB3013320.1 aspartyl-tRNA(Asn)/glutamyl-tRNA(Gln) amidotransferase subunit A [Cupriavidus alkaliphilus]
MAADIPSAAVMAAQVRSGERPATALVRDALQRAEAAAPLNACSALLAHSALAQAAALDRRRAGGQPMPPLAGVPFVVKNLLDVLGHATLAGAEPRAQDPPATRHADAVEALVAAGAVPVALAAMDEYACGATGENVIGGPVRNPLDPLRITGGSSAGTAALVAAGVVPFGLGSDTNGSIRAPAAFCGIWGLRPTTGRLSLRGCVPYAQSLDTVGPMAGSAADLALAYAAMLGVDAPEAAQHHGRPTTLRVGVLGRGFADFAEPAAQSAVLRVASAFGAVRTIDLPDADAARNAASVISAYEVGRNHQAMDFSTRHGGYSAFVRQRILAGLAMPRDWYDIACRYQSSWRQRLLALFDDVDLLLAPSTPYAATPIGADVVEGAGRIYRPRADAGHMTRPLSLAGLPVVAAPCAGEGLPVGIQIVAPPWRESLALAAGHFLEAQGLCSRAVPRSL